MLSCLIYIPIWIFLRWSTIPSSFLSSLPVVDAFSKVLVPAIHDEFDPTNYPGWISDPEILAKYNYSVVLYQKHTPTAPYYIAKNRGTEGAVYLRYIVDHYDNFPDVAIFVHGYPEDHAPNWLQMIGCISPNATYMSINVLNKVHRTIDAWGLASIWMEQCFRDVLSIVWGLEDNKEELIKRLPINEPFEMIFPCCNQFILSRNMVHKRPLEVWKKILHIINEQDVCHEGEPEYQYLNTTVTSGKLGPEMPSIEQLGETAGTGYGAHTQGGAMEHLVHVIYGHHDLKMRELTKEDYCQNFIPNCPLSPCDDVHSLVIPGFKPLKKHGGHKPRPKPSSSYVPINEQAIRPVGPTSASATQLNDVLNNHRIHRPINPNGNKKSTNINGRYGQYSQRQSGPYHRHHRN